MNEPPGEPTLQYLPLDAITWDERVQPRKKLDQEAISDYSQSYKDGVEMPPGKVVLEGDVYWGSCGWHRKESAKRAGLTSLPFLVYEGTFKQARAMARADNLNQCVRYRSEDRQKMVRDTIEDYPLETDTAIARHCGVGYALVRAERARAACDMIKEDRALTEEAVHARTGIRHDDYEVALASARSGSTPAVSQLPRRPTSSNSRPNQGGRKPRQVKFEEEAADDEHARAMDALRKNAERRAKEDAKLPEPIYDQLGVVVPDHLRDLFAAAGLPELAEDVERLRASLGSQIEPLVERAGELSRVYGYLRLPHLARHLRSLPEKIADDIDLAVEVLIQAAPHSVCSACRGHGKVGNSGCERCMDQGYLTRCQVTKMDHGGV